MKITASYEGLTRIENGDYVLEKDLIVDGSIEIELDDRFVVKGRLEATKSIIAECGIEAGCGIKAGCGIEAGCGIKAGWGIEAGWGIKAGCGIEAGDGIEAKMIDCKKRIFAGISLYRTSKDCIKTIKCQKLTDGEIAYGDLIIESEDK